MNEPIPIFLDCGSCGCYHREDFRGDCRQDDERFTAGELDEMYGPAGWDWSDHADDWEGVPGRDPRA